MGTERKNKGSEGEEKERGYEWDSKEGSMRRGGKDIEV